MIDGRYYEFQRWARPEERDVLGPDLDYVSSSDLEHSSPAHAQLVMVDLLSYGDYNGGSLEEANNRSFREQFADLQGVEWWNVHSTIGLDNGIAIRADADERHPEIEEFFGALANYPVIDEDLMSEIEMEHRVEQWADYAARDFRREILRVLGADDEILRSDGTVLLDRDTPDDDAAHVAYAALAEVTNTCPEEESGGGVYWNFKRVLQPVKRLAVLGEANPAMVDLMLPLLLAGDYRSLQYGGAAYQMLRALHRASDDMLAVANDVAMENDDPQAGFALLTRLTKA